MKYKSITDLSGRVPQPAIETDKNACTMGMLCHLLGLAGFVIPFGNIVGPLVLWLIKKDEFSFVKDQGREALNFQISITIYAIASIFMVPLCGVGVILAPAVGVFALVMLIIATVKANSGIAYRYPLTIRFIK